MDPLENPMFLIRMMQKIDSVGTDSVGTNMSYEKQMWTKKKASL